MYVRRRKACVLKNFQRHTLDLFAAGSSFGNYNSVGTFLSLSIRQNLGKQTLFKLSLCWSLLFNLKILQTIPSIRDTDLSHFPSREAPMLRRSNKKREPVERKKDLLAAIIVWTPRNAPHRWVAILLRASQIYTRIWLTLRVRTLATITKVRNPIFQFRLNQSSRTSVFVPLFPFSSLFLHFCPTNRQETKKIETTWKLSPCVLRSVWSFRTSVVCEALVVSALHCPNAVISSRIRFCSYPAAD